MDNGIEVQLDMVHKRLLFPKLWGEINSTCIVKISG